MTVRDAQRWFEQWFFRHYPPDLRAKYHEIVAQDANPANNPTIDAHIEQAALMFVQNAPKLLGCELSFDARGVGTLARALSAEKIAQLEAVSRVDDPENLLFNTIIHGALYLGECAVRAHGFRWSARRPLWESRVVRLVADRSGKLEAQGEFSPFQWLLKHMDEREIAHSKLADRFAVHVEFASMPLHTLTPFVAAKRYAALKKPTYDLLVKYIHQHFDRLNDLGKTFLSPAEFTSRAYESLGFEHFYDGRVLVMHGMHVPEASSDGQATVDLHWLTSAGTVRMDLLPCDAHPPYFARKTGELLEVTTAIAGKPHTHRVGIRGHG
jgi:hypothetical protein